MFTGACPGSSECPPGLVFNSNKSTDTGPGGRLPRRLLPPHLPVFTAPFLYCAFPWPSTPPNPLYPLPRPSGHKVFPHALISFCLTHPHSIKHPRNGLFPLSQSREESQKKIPPRLKNPRRYVAQLNSPPPHLPAKTSHTTSPGRSKGSSCPEPVRFNILSKTLSNASLT